MILPFQPRINIGQKNNNKIDRLFIIVSFSRDFSPPTFNDTCPGNLVFYTGNCEDRVTVSWTDPVATDNSQSMAMTYPAIRPPANLTVDLYKILYTATDKKGNSANCSFAVQVTSKYVIH